MVKPVWFQIVSDIAVVILVLILIQTAKIWITLSHRTVCELVHSFHSHNVEGKLKFGTKTHFGNEKSCAFFWYQNLNFYSLKCRDEAPVLVAHLEYRHRISTVFCFACTNLDLAWSLSMMIFLDLVNLLFVTEVRWILLDLFNT